MSVRELTLRQKKSSPTKQTVKNYETEDKKNPFKNNVYKKDNVQREQNENKKVSGESALFLSATPK